jgi:fibronectin-binding autotransporter adhesin
MKTTSHKSRKAADVSAELYTGKETLQVMKIGLRVLKLFVILFGVFAATAGFGQVTRTFTNSVSIDIGLANSWDPNGAPNGANQDTAQWDGVVPGNLTLRYLTGWGNSGFGTLGVNLVLTANQVGNVTILGPTSGNSPAAGINAITNSSAGAALVLGDASNNQLAFATRPGTAGTVHGFVNNSSIPAVMNSSVNWVFGGGVTCLLDFGGTGDWIINHSLRANNTPGPYIVQWEGPGTMTWSNGGVFVSALGPVTNLSGTIVLKGAGLLPNFTGVPVGNNTITLSNASVLKYDATIADEIPRVIYGSGTVQVNNGTLTLSGPSIYTGTTLLSGGELIVGSAETLGVSGPLGVGGTISFTGGTLGFSGANTYDYSPRFDPSGSQAYKFNTHGLGVLLTNNLASSGGTLTKAGPGTLTLGGTSSYSGLTTVSAGRLVFQGSKTGSANITVANSAALGVTANGTQVTPGTLTVGTTGGATLEFNNVNSTTTELMLANTISTGGTVTVNVNGGTFVAGQSYPLMTWTNGAPAFNLGIVIGAVGNLSVVGKTLLLNVTALSYIWSGANNNNWDISTPNNWIFNAAPAIFANGGGALLDDTASGSTAVNLNSPVSPAGVTINNNSKAYSITSSGANLIGGTGGLTKANGGTLALSGGVNTYSGPSTLIGGSVSVGALANGGSPSDIGASGNGAANLVFNSGTLQYTNGGAVSIDRLFTLGTGGGTIDASGNGTLSLNNGGLAAYTGTGARVLTLAGVQPGDNTLAVSLADNGGATAITKSGPGKWVLTGTNAHSGVTTINNGTLQIGAGGAIGSPGTGNIVDNGAIVFNRTGTLTVNTITGTGSLTNDGTGTIILPGNNTYQGGTTINAGTLQIGNGGATGSIDVNDPVINNGTALIINSTGDLTLSGAISGTGQLIKRGSGLLKFLGNNTYTGTTTIDPGAQLQLWQNNTGANASPAITNNGTLIMMRQDNLVATYAGNISGTGPLKIQVSNGNGGDSSLTGTNTYTGGTYILGGGLVLGNGGLTPFGGSIIGDVFMTNDYVHATFGPFVAATLTFNRLEDLTFSGNIVGDGNVIQNGTDVLTFTGNNTYTNGTTISAGTLQLGAGGASGSAGTGDITDNSALIFNRSDDVILNSAINGVGTVLKLGAGKLTLNNLTNGYGGNTTISNGSLIINGTNLSAAIFVNGGTLGGTGTLNGPVVTDPGTTLAPGASVGTLTINSDLSIGGNLAIELNKSLAQSNDLVVVSGVLTNTGSGTLTVANLGPILTPGDKFTLFSQPLLHGSTITVTGGSATWINNLASDGSITVNTVVGPPTLNVSPLGGGNLQFSWTGSFKLQAQTNSLTVGLRSNWGDYPGGGTSPVTVAVNPTNGTVFFRLVSP